MIDSDLDAPVVPAEFYDQSYFMHSCMGADDWRESGGRRMSGLYEGMLKLAGFSEGTRLLDIGTGRGELVCVAARLGSKEAIGVDYAPAAIELARRTLEAAGNPPGVEVLLADARRLPVSSDHFDLATMLDVVEHLAPAELEAALSGAWRALRPGGSLFIHTAPNPLIYEVTYKAQRLLRRHRRRRWPAEPRNEFELRLHVNEQRVGALRSALRRVGFKSVRANLGQWVYTDFVPDEPARRTYRRLSRLPALRHLAIADVFARGVKPGPS